jgi:hypothetical protein
MRFRRVLLLAALDEPSHGALETIRRVAPDCEHLWIAASPPRRSWTWPGSAQAPELDTLDEQVAALRRAATAAASEVEIEVVEGVEAEHLEARIAAAAIELVVLAPPALPRIAAVAQVRRRRPLYVLWAPAGPPPERPLREILCVMSSSRSRDPMVAFLREHATPALHCRLLVPPSGAPVDLTAALAAEGIDASVELASGAEALLAVAPPPTPLLVLPPALPPDRRHEPALDLPDLLIVDGFARARLRHALGVGRREPIRDQTVEVLAGGAVVATLDTAGGVLDLDAALCGEGVGVRRAGGTVTAEIHVRVLRPGDRPLVLADASLPPEGLAALAARSAAVDLLSVRLLPVRSCRAIRARWRAAGLPALVADASAVLDEGEAFDVSAAADAVRLARVASRLRANGYPVVAIVYTHGGKPFGVPWSTARTTATELVHSRMDALVEAGAEAYRLAVPEQPGWEPGLGIVRPHVHAKVLTADGEACAIGSANLDVTAGYWESEVLLVVEDPAVTRAVEARASQLIAGSDRVDRDDPDWRAAALRRRWMHRWPGVLSV